MDVASSSKALTQCSRSAYGEGYPSRPGWAAGFHRLQGSSHQELCMIQQYLWSLAFALALVSVGLVVRVVQIVAPSRRPVPVESR
jgi:hypothetical protein